MNAYDLLDYARGLASGSFIYDVTANAVYMANFNEDNSVLYGINIYYLLARGKELEQQANRFGCGLQELCVKGIPSISASANEYGYMVQFDFEYETKTEGDIAKALLRFMIDEFCDRKHEDLWTEGDWIIRGCGEEWR